MSDRFAGKLQRLQAALLRGPGTLDPAVRQALADAGAVPAPLAPYADKVTRHAYRVTDEDIAALHAAGYSDDQIFEATLSIAFGAAYSRLRAGLNALADAANEGEE